MTPPNAVALPRGFWGHAIDVLLVEATTPPAIKVWGEQGPPIVGEHS